MNWGVTDEFINQEKTTELCLNEIKCCQEISIGPSFVVIEKLRKLLRNLFYK